MNMLLIVLLSLLILVGLYFLLRTLIRVYIQFHGRMIVTCPENKAPAGVRVDVNRLLRSAFVGKRHLRLQDCSRWPERQDCGQTCLRQIESAPESCLVRNWLTDWYRGKKCFYCGRAFYDINWHDHKPAVRDPEGELISWHEIPAERLPVILATHRPVCWNCYIAESFRREYPDLVVDRPWKRDHLDRY